MPMRILGAIFLIAGFLLCLTIVWAAIGFLAMGLGLICLLIAERRQEQIKQRPLPQTSNSRQEAEKAIPEQKVGSSAEAPELPKAERHPPYPGDSRSPALSRRSSSEEEDRLAANKGMVAAGRRPHAAEGRRLIAKGRADASRATTAISLATSPEIVGAPAVPKNENSAARLGSAASSGRSNRPLASPSQSIAATRGAPSTETPPNRQEAKTATRSASHSMDAGVELAREGVGTVTSVEGDPVLRKPLTDAEDVRDLAELLSKITRPVPSGEHG